ncbi:hypothetical protein KPL78_03720 [Roseomonas sp. HJA6]|uniref:Uncharacterized protein n=1 Tax=Roseomonas alba TaxID=2846776 RepID=A0ABS7A3R6_9PROT|nr:hypothetical protein [Neoroseomonas alba]MBW6396939.1 hypothetical protein [Neoroseomonas alba]
MDCDGGDASPSFNYPSHGMQRNIADAAARIMKRRRPAQGPAVAQNGGIIPTSLADDLVIGKADGMARGVGGAAARKSTRL